MYTLGQVMDRLGALAPTYLAEKWDNVGLLIGSKAQPVKKVLCALDINLEVVEEAIAEGASCIVTHHPFIFSPMARIDFDTPKGNMIKRLIQNDIAVYSMHTNWDIAKGGINDLIADKFDLKQVKPLLITKTEDVYKVAIYAPKECANDIREVMIKHNPCTIGNYKGCTFVSQGTGSFVPLEGSNPYIGQQDECECVEEIKLECMAYKKDIETILAEVAKVHPYEEIAYDTYLLDNIKNYEGLGRYGQIESITLEAFVAKVKEVFGIPYIRLIGERKEPITSLAICSGSGSEFLAQAARVADIYITGDMKFHEAQAAIEQGLIIVDVGHYASENIAIPYLSKFLSSELPDLEVKCSKVNGEVFQII